MAKNQPIRMFGEILSRHNSLQAAVSAGHVTYHYSHLLMGLLLP